MIDSKRLTLHVLDVTKGLPAAGLAVTLTRLGDTPGAIARIITDADGRCAAPLLAGAEMMPGTYQLEFEVGAFFGAAESTDRYLDVVPVRFGIASTDLHVHVALLVTPWSYTTYRGS